MSSFVKVKVDKLAVYNKNGNKSAAQHWLEDPGAVWCGLKCFSAQHACKE